MHKFSSWLPVSVHDMYEILQLTASVCSMLRWVSVTGDSEAHRSADSGWLLVLPNERQKPLDGVLHQGVTEWRLRDHRYSNTVVELFLIGFIILMLHLDRTIYNIHVCKVCVKKMHFSSHCRSLDCFINSMLQRYMNQNRMYMKLIFYQTHF